MKRFLLIAALTSAVSASAASEVPIIDYECKSSAEASLTPEVRKKAREEYGEKYIGKRQVLGDKIFRLYENQPTVLYCLFYEIILPRPPERPGKKMLALAPAGVFFCLLL